MKKTLLLLTLLGLVGINKAQDQIFKKDNSKLLVKITEVSPDEIKYKLFSNLTGPVYVLNKNEVSLLIYENGQHEVISSNAPQATVAYPQNRPAGPYVRPSVGMSKEDSLKYYKYSRSLSMNFLSFLNMEVGLLYQKDFLKSNFNIIIPVAVGLAQPSINQSVYFNSNSLELNRKLFEVGLGLNYYPSLRFPVNYYVGPAIRYMQYSCTQNYTYSTYSNQPYQNSYQSHTLTKNGTLSRYCVTITNGFIFRTKSRLVLNVFGSIGFKNDVVNTELTDPVTNRKVKPINDPINLYFWSGFSVGFSF